MTDPIKQRIQELVPEVMALKFGCGVLYRYENEEVVPMIFYGTFGDDIILGDEEMGNLVTDAIKADITKILGSPIGLAEVLRAIGKENWNMYDIALLLNYWNFSADWDGQTKRTQEFIGKILGV